MSSQNTPFALVGSVAGGLGASAGFLGGGPAGAALGSQIGGAFGTVLQAVLQKPQDAAKTADAHWGGVTYGTFLARGWADHRTDGLVFWARRNKDGSYIFQQTAKKHKKSGSQPVNHARATFAFHILETGLTFPDGRQVERRIVVDRVWVADKIRWVNRDAQPLPVWDPAATYFSGDYVSYGGHDWWSVGDGNVNHTPGASGTRQWWQKVSTGKNWRMSFHPQEGESTFTMAASSVIASHKGLANTAARRGSTYGVVDDEDMFDAGNQLPWGSIRTDWHFADPDYSLGDFLSDVCGMAGMPEGSYDFSDVTEKMPGYRQTARQGGADLVSQPLSVLGYDLATVDGVVRAIKRGGPIVASLSLAELGARIDGQSVGDGGEDDLLSEEIPADPTDLPSALKLGYYDALAGYRQDFETAVRNDGSLGQPTDLGTDLVLTPDRAAGAAGYVLDATRLEAGASFGCSVLGTRAALCPGDPITVPWNGLTTRFRITKVVRVVGLLRLTLARDEASTLVRHEVGQGRETSGADDGTIVPTLFLPISPATDLSTDFARFPGFYLYANGPAGWLGGQVVFTFDPPGTEPREWVQGPFVADASTFGVLTGTLDGGGAATLPGAPTGLSATPGDAQVALSWGTVGGATSYSVKRATVSGGPYTTVQTGLTSPSWIDTGRTNGTTYWYVVSATNAAGEGPNSSQAGATPGAGASTNPTVPQGGSATFPATGSAGSFGMPVGSWRVVDPSNADVGTTASPNGWSVSYGAGNLTVGAPSTAPIAVGYDALLRSSDGTGPSAFFDVVAGTAGPPSAPTGLGATGGTAKVALAWAASAGATSYTVKRGTASGSYPTTVATGLTSPAYTETGLTNGTAYHYAVFAVNASGTSAASSDAAAVPIAAPTGLATNPGSGSVALAWSSAAGATGYRVYWGTASGGPYASHQDFSGTSGLVSGLTNGTTYWFVVRGTNVVGESDSSTEASATPSGGLPTNPPHPRHRRRRRDGPLSPP